VRLRVQVRVRVGARARARALRPGHVRVWAWQWRYRHGRGALGMAVALWAWRWRCRHGSGAVGMAEVFTIRAGCAHRHTSKATASWSGGFVCTTGWLPRLLMMRLELDLREALRLREPSASNCVVLRPLLFEPSDSNCVAGGFERL